jgi:hypothetical protein
VEFKVEYNLARRLEVEEGTKRLRGTLPEILVRGKCDRKKFALLNSLIKLVAEAWSMPESVFENQQWEMTTEYAEESLSAALMRPADGSLSR